MYIWIVGYWRCGTNWVTTLLHPLVDKVIADSDITDNTGIRKFRDENLNFIEKELDQFKSYKLLACKMNCLTYEQAKILLMKFPNSRFINVGRDDKDVAQSIVKSKKDSFPKRNFNMNMEDAFEFILHWKFEHLYLFMDDRFNKITYFLRYENLVDNFEEEYRRMCEWLERYEDDYLNKIVWPKQRMKKWI